MSFARALLGPKGVRCHLLPEPGGLMGSVAILTLKVRAKDRPEQGSASGWSLQYEGIIEDCLGSFPSPYYWLSPLLFLVPMLLLAGDDKNFHAFQPALMAVPAVWSLSRRWGWAEW